MTRASRQGGLTGRADTDAFYGAPPWGTKTKRFDPATSVYNLKPNHLLRTRGALGKARAGAGKASIGFCGDSTVGGVGTGVQPSVNSWPDFFQKYMENAGYPTNGSGLVAAFKNTAPDTRITYGAGWAALSGATATLTANSTNANPLTFASLNTGTIARVYYANNSSGPFNVSIDGGADVLVTPVAGQTLGLYEVTGLSNATHTIAVKRSSGSAQIAGFEVQNTSVNGVRYYNSGIGSARMAGFASSTWFTPSPIMAGTNFNADLVFLMTQVNDINDINNSIQTVANYKAQTATAVGLLRANGADVVLVTAVPGAISSLALDMGPTANALYELAETLDVPLVDLGARYGSSAAIIAQGLMSADGLHPLPALYADIARTVFNGLGF